MAMQRKRRNTRPKRRPIFRRKSPQLAGARTIDPSDYDLLRRFVTDHGKIIPSRLTGATAGQQRQIKRAVRRAREMGIIA